MGETRADEWLTIGMTRRAGVDLGQALREGILTREDFAETVAHCRSCDDPAACRGEAPAELPESPHLAHCRNAALLLELRAF